MKTIEDIRKDLKNIKYYYSRKDKFEKAISSVGENKILDLIKIYNEAVCYAPPRLYDLYVSLYMDNNTQFSLSEKFGFTVEYMSKLHRQLVAFLYKKLANECKGKENVF